LEHAEVCNAAAAAAAAASAVAAAASAVNGSGFDSQPRPFLPV